MPVTVKARAQITLPRAILDRADSSGAGFDRTHRLAVGGTPSVVVADVIGGGLVVARRGSDGQWTVHEHAARLPAGGVPVIIRSTARADEIRAVDLVRDVEFPAEPTLRPDGGDASDVNTIWRTSVAASSAGVLRADSQELGAWSVLAFYNDPSAVEPAWRVDRRAEDGPAAIVGAALAPRGERAIVALAGREPPWRLASHRTADGGQEWSVELSSRPSEWQDDRSPIAFAPDGKTFAIVLDDPQRCETCERAEIRRASDGTLVRSLRLAASGAQTTARFAYGEQTDYGFTGDVLWFYRYQPARESSHIIGSSPGERPASCAYEVYDARRDRGKPIRTLDAARGVWKESTKDCRVRGLFTLSDSSTVALRYQSAAVLELIHFSAVP